MSCELDGEGGEGRDGGGEGENDELCEARISRVVDFFIFIFFPEQW